MSNEARSNMKSFAACFKHMPGKEKAAVSRRYQNAPRQDPHILEVCAAAIVLKYLVSIFFSPF